MKKKHILMIAYTTYLYDTRVRREAETLAALPEYDVSFIIPKVGDFPRRYVMDGVNIIELNMNQYQGKNKLRYLTSYFKFLALSFIACTKSFFLHNIDIIHVHNMPNFLTFAAIIPRLFGKKIILDVHDSVPETYAAKFGFKSNMLFKLLCWEESLNCRIAHKIICVNHIQRDALIKRGIPAHKIDISLNVPDHKRFGLKANSNGNGGCSTNFKLIYHGTLVKRLGVDLTIQAVARLVDKIPCLEFNIMGCGDDAMEFVELSKSLGVDQCIHFNNFVPIDFLVPILEGMHLGVVANRRNIATELMLPVKMLEYVALEIPVVAPRLKTIQYYFTDDMVSYFEPENVDSLANAILGLYNDESKRKRQVQMAKSFIKKYGWQNHQNDLINLYKSLSSD